MLTELLILGCWYGYYYFWESLRGKLNNFSVLLRKACNVMTKRMCECSSCFRYLRLPSCLHSHLFAETRYWRTNWESRPLQTDSSLMLLLFMAWWTGLIGGHSGKADGVKGEIWSGFLFWSQTSYRRVCWVESSRRRNVQRDDTLWLQVIISAQTCVTHHGTNFLVGYLSSWLPLQTVCMLRQHFGLFNHFIYFWLFGFQLLFYFLMIP